MSSPRVDGAPDADGAPALRGEIIDVGAEVWQEIGPSVGIWSSRSSTSTKASGASADSRTSSGKRLRDSTSAAPSLLRSTPEWLAQRASRSEERSARAGGTSSTSRGRSLTIVTLAFDGAVVFGGCFADPSPGPLDAIAKKGAARDYRTWDT